MEKLTQADSIWRTDLGVETAPIPRKQFTVERLAQAIQAAVGDRSMRQRAADLGAKIRSEDGVMSVVAMIKKLEMIITKTPIEESFPLT